jgi:hypothetical protein
MRALELFKGTGSVGKVLRGLFPECEIYSLDIIKKYHPTHCGDIMEWDYKQFPVGHFDIIWGSPECKIYSSLQQCFLKTEKNTKSGRWKWETKEHLDKAREKDGIYSKRTMEIIDYYKPKYWFVENPWNSAMVKLEHMKDLPSIRVDYCRFGYGYKKPTRIWTNQKLDDMICECKEFHKFRIGVNGKEEVGRRERQMDKADKTNRQVVKPINDKTKMEDRYSIPPKLLEYLFQNL